MATLQFVGCDPEFFLKDSSGNDISAHDLVPGTKSKPFSIYKGSLQADGTAAEIGIDPAATVDEFLSNLDTVMSQLSETVYPNRVCYDASRSYTKDVWDNIPDQAKELGCEPDFNAYTGFKNEVPKLEDERFRTAAGHIHLGWTSGVDVNDEGHLDSCMIYVRELDYYVGSVLALIENDDPNAVKRRDLYGAAGCFRPKPYGVEYRSPSNKWVKDPEVAAWVYKTCHWVFDQLLEGKYKHQDPSNTVMKIFSGSCSKMFAKRVSSILKGTGITIPKAIQSKLEVLQASRAGGSDVEKIQRIFNLNEEEATQLWEAIYEEVA